MVDSQVNMTLETVNISTGMFSTSNQFYLKLSVADKIVKSEMMDGTKPINEHFTM